MVVEVAGGLEIDDDRRRQEEDGGRATGTDHQRGEVSKREGDTLGGIKKGTRRQD